MELSRPVNARNVSLLVISMALWGLSFPAVKISLIEVQPLTLGLLRIVFGAVPIAAFVFCRRGFSHIFKIFRSDPKPFIGIALAQYYLPMAAQNIGMNMMASETAASLSSILQATSPVFGIVFAAMFLGEYIGIKKSLGLAMALCGSLLLVTRGGAVLGGSDLIGNLLLLSSAIFYAVSGVWTKRALSKHEPIVILALALIISSVLFIPTALFAEPISQVHDVSVTTWGLIIFLGLVCNGVALLVWYIVLIHSQLSKQVLFTYLIPLFGTLFSHLLIGELIGIPTVVFGGLILAGITVAQYGK